MNDNGNNFMGYLGQPCEYTLEGPAQTPPNHEQSGTVQRSGYSRCNFETIPARYHPYSSVPRYQHINGNYNYQRATSACSTVQSTYSVTEPQSYDRQRNNSLMMDNNLTPLSHFGNSNSNNNVMTGCSYNIGAALVPSNMYGQVGTQHLTESLYNCGSPAVSPAYLSGINKKEYLVNQRFSNCPTSTPNRSRLFQTMEIESASSPEQDYNEVEAGVKKRGPKKRKKKGANEPQKPVSAYALFFRDTQAAIKAENPNATFGEISKIVASMWDSLSEEAKQVYKQKTESAKRDYLKQLAAYRANLVSRGGLDADEDESQPLSLLKIKMSDSNHSVLPPMPKLQMAPSSSNKDWSSTIPNVPETNLSSMPTDVQLKGARAPSPSLVSVSFSSANGNSAPVVQMSPGSQGLAPPPIQLRNIVPKANSPVAFLPSKPGQVIKVLPASQAASIANSQSGRTRIIKMADMLRPVVSQASSAEVCSPTQSVQPILQMLAQENEVEQSCLSAATEGVFQTKNDSGGIEYIDLTDTQAPLLESQELEPTSTKFKETLVHYCIREGCNNVAIADPQWNEDYCSNECVVSHCRRFMKKPNFAEASEEFLKIAKNLNNDGCHAYAGLCHMAVARCEQSMMNTAGEIHHLVEAAKSFLQAHNDVDLIRCPHCRENISSALSCCDAVIKICLSKDMPKDALSLCWKLGEWFECNMEFDKAIVQFQRCESLCICNSFQLFLTHKKLFSLHLRRNTFLAALNHGTQMLEVGQTLVSSEQTDAYFPLQNECETTVVLLILLLNPHPLNIKEQHSTILQKYIWSEDQDAFHQSISDKNEDFFILMQSLVITCSAQDIGSIQKLQVVLRKFFTVEQNFLLNKILEEYNHHSGLGF